jgi:hypothetical protein
MNEPLTYTVAPSRAAPKDGIKRADSASVLDPGNCEMNVNVGIFFDGTGNNREADTPKFKHSNIVRLWGAYLDKPADGYYRIYIPGVGTEFLDIREKGTSVWGAGFGIGCEGRVLYALLRLFNVIHQAACNSQPLISKKQISALCCNRWNPLDNADVEELAKLGQSSGLLMAGGNGTADREKILLSLVSLLRTRLLVAKPRVKECFIDVFGFSRGAAQARVFCSWLNRILDNDTLAGVSIQIRFLGIMDTVAAAGIAESIAGNGHGGWAEPANLRISPSIGNCVHMVAMHELRSNFPLDTVTVNGIMPPNCREFAYPGAHSDVGGGYRPEELGISVGKDRFESDSLKLAQIPLNHMFDCAVEAGSPLSKKRANEADEPGFDSFAIAPALQAAYDEFLALATMEARPVKDWLQPYLNWRWDRRLVYTSLGHVRKASEKDRALLIRYNNYFLSDLAVLESDAKSKLYRVFSQSGSERQQEVDEKKNREEARAILQIAQKTAPDDCMKFHAMFDGFVHDSLAGFDMHAIELSGHWRYRKGFLGSDEAKVVDAETSARAASRA